MSVKRLTHQSLVVLILLISVIVTILLLLKTPNQMDLNIMPSKNPSLKTKIGIVAGNGDLVRDVIQCCLSQKIPFHVLAYEGQTDTKLIQNTPHTWLKLGQAGKALKTFKENNVTTVVMAGYFNRPSWSDIKPDIKGVKLLSKLVGKPMGDDGLFRVIIDFFEQEGFDVISPEDIIGGDTLIAEGILTQKKPSEQDYIDIQRGFKVAKGIGRLDIGQSVVMQNGLVLGVEALEGSDNLIKRTADLKADKQGGVFVKVIKPGQDTRVDRSVIGPETVLNAANAGLSGIAAETKSIIIINKDQTIALANEKGLFIIGISYDL